MRPTARLALATATLLAAVVATEATAQPTAPFQRIWGTLWYLRSMAEIDDLTLVYGGVEGSSVLVYRDYAAGKSHWVYLEGSMPLFVAFGQGLPYEEETGTPGEVITTQQSFVWSSPKEANRRDLSYALVDVYNNSKADAGSPTIQHVPFLMGKGWPAGGAPKHEAQDIIEGIGLTYDEANPGSGYYVTAQSHVAGTLLSAPTTITVTLGGSPPNTQLSTVSGDTWRTAVPIDDPGDGSSAVELAREITVQFTHTKDAPIHGGPIRKDIFFELPEAAQGRLVTVTQVGLYDRLVLTAFERNTDGDDVAPVTFNGNAAVKVGVRPKLVFFHPPNRTCFVMAENAYRNHGRIRLRFEW